jgi:hypothetical protein
MKIPFVVSQIVEYAHPRFLKTSALFGIKLFDFSKKLIASVVLLLASSINHFK